MKSYSAILCDLFRTVVSLELDRLPLVQLDGESRHSTIGVLHGILAESHPHLDLAALRRAWGDVSAETLAEKLRTNREINIALRVRKVLERLGIGVGEAARSLEQRLIAVHMGWIDRCSELPGGNLLALETLQAHARLALVSNFDCAQTGHAILERLGLERYFEVIVISDELGWRKPHPTPFLFPLERMGIEPSRALFVGDSPADDIVGAKGAGLDVAWLNSDSQKLPEGIPLPDLVLRSLADLPQALGLELQARG